MEQLAKLKSLIIGLVMLVFLAFVSSNASAYTFVNETMTSNNATLWADIAGTIIFNANFVTSQYGVKFPIQNAGMTSNDITGYSTRLIYGKQIDMGFSFMTNFSCYAPSMRFTGGLGVSSGYPKWYIEVNGNSNLTLYLYEGSTVVYGQAILPDTLYRIKMRNVGSTSSLFIDDVLVYTNSLSTLNIYDTANVLSFARESYGTGVCKLNAFMNNLTLTQQDTGYLANFTVLDEIGTFPINFTALRYLLYDSSGNVVDSKTTSTSMVTFSNLSSVEYRLDYQDSVYMTRSYRFTPVVYWSNYTLYIINNSVSLPVSIIVTDALYQRTLPNANVKIYKSINNTQTKIYDGYTDGNGIAVAYLNTTSIFTITATLQGYSDYTTIVNNIQAPYQQTLKLSPNNQFNASSVYDYFTASVSPSNSVSLINTTPLYFELNTFSPYYAIQYFGITSTVGGTSYNNHSTSPSGGNLTLAIVPTQKYINITYYIKIYGYGNLTNKMLYVVYNQTANNGTIDKAASDLKNQFSEKERTILVFASAIAVSFGMMMLCMITGLPIIVAFMIGIPGTIFFFSIINWISGWYIVVIGLLSLLILLNRGRPNG